eukprot:573139-Hanusia_phi.AAC.1
MGHSNRLRGRGDVTSTYFSTAGSVWGCGRSGTIGRVAARSDRTRYPVNLTRTGAPRRSLPEFYTTVVEPRRVPIPYY